MPRCISRAALSPLRGARNAASIRVLEFRQCFERLLGRLQQDHTTVGNLQIVERNGHEMLADAEESSDGQNRVKCACGRRLARRSDHRPLPMVSLFFVEHVRAGQLRRAIAARELHNVRSAFSVIACGACACALPSSEKGVSGTSVLTSSVAASSALGCMLRMMVSPCYVSRRSRRVEPSRLSNALPQIACRVAPWRATSRPADCYTSEPLIRIAYTKKARARPCFSQENPMSSPANYSTRIAEGTPFPLGATWNGNGVNFALFSAHATKVELCLFDETGRA